MPAGPSMPGGPGVPGGDLAGLFSRDGAIDPQVALALGDLLAGGHPDPPMQAEAPAPAATQDVPSMPGGPGMPAAPSMPGAPSMAAAPSMPGAPSKAAAPSMPGMPDGDLAGLFSRDGAIDPEVARAVGELLAGDHPDPPMQGEAPAPAATQDVPSWLEPGVSGIELVAPSSAAGVVPGGSSMLMALKTGLTMPESSLSALSSQALSAPVPVSQPGDGEYYFVEPPASVSSAPASPASPAAPTAALGAPAGMSFPTEIFDVETVRKDFPVLDQRVHGQQLIWLDNAATTQKPQVVIDRLAAYYENDNSNVHRGAHTLAARATEGYEGAREAVRRFLGAGSTEEIIFVRGATEAINLVAQSFGGMQLQPGDEILLTTLEHHSNIVPWQLIAAATGANVRAIPISSTGEVLLEEYGMMLGPRTKIVGMTHVSNALGTIVPVREMVDMAHRAGAWTVVDGAQAVAHLPVDVKALNADFYAFSGHKLFAPTGIGVLYGKKELLEEMPPWQGGGSMIEDVTFERTRYAGLPQKFEAGTPIIAGAIGLGAAIDYLDRLGLENIARYERALTEYATAALQTVPGLTLIGTAPEKVGVLSFVLEGIPVEHLGRYLDQYGIALRAGHHCAQPTLRAFGLESTVRPSLAVYNTTRDVDHLTDALKQAQARATR
jgi:cysteine desulfurase/selenocysteine lyase